MVWTAFTASGILEIQFTSTKMKSSDYIAVLQCSLLPFLEQNSEIPYILQQDNARIHVSKETKSFLPRCSVEIMEWPACSPDLKPIENIWGVLVPRVYANNRHFDTTDELKGAIIAESNLLELSLLNKLVNFMKKRLFEVAKANGASIGY